MPTTHTWTHTTHTEDRPEQTTVTPLQGASAGGRSAEQRLGDVDRAPPPAGAERGQDGRRSQRHCQRQGQQECHAEVLRPPRCQERARPCLLLAAGCGLLAGLRLACLPLRGLLLRSLLGRLLLRSLLPWRLLLGRLLLGRLLLGRLLLGR